jgi:hypothetical protein
VLYCDVYPLREEGRKLPREAVSAGRVSGWLRVYTVPMGPPTFRAELADVEGADVLPPLKCVTLRKIDAGGILLQGLLDTGRSVAPVRQSWWCVPRPAGAEP